MSSPETAVSEPMAGQIWSHVEYEYDVLVTRVTENHVHYSLRGEEAHEQAAAARRFIEETYGHVLAYVAPTAGSCLDPNEFEETFDYVMDRPRKSYESDAE